jgi:hypothetical protein
MTRPPTAGLALVALVGLSPMAAWAASDHAVRVLVDGKPVEFTSRIIGTHQPAIVLRGHPMLPVRFLSEVLGQDLNVALMPWGIVQVGRTYFREGDKEAITPVPKVGGDVTMRRALPIVPRVLNGTFYVPAEGALRALAYDMTWDPRARTLAISTPEVR